MKKKYINPEINIVKLQTQQILAGSELNLNSGNATEWGARQGGGFFDDEEDF